MLLVMDTAGIFQSVERQSSQSASLWDLTWDKLDTFLPTLMVDLFGDRQKGQQIPTTTFSKQQQQQQQQHNIAEQKVAESLTQSAENSVQHVEQASETVTQNLENPDNLARTVENLSLISDTVEIVTENEAVDVEEERNVERETDVAPKNYSTVENPPLSPMDPPAVSPSFFIPNEPFDKPSSTFDLSMSTGPRLPFRSTHIPPPMPTIISLPSRPTIAPMPPPPPGNAFIYYDVDKRNFLSNCVICLATDL